MYLHPAHHSCAQEHEQSHHRPQKYRARGSQSREARPYRQRGGQQHKQNEQAEAHANGHETPCVLKSERWRLKVFPKLAEPRDERAIGHIGGFLNRLLDVAQHGHHLVELVHHLRQRVRQPKRLLNPRNTRQRLYLPFAFYHRRQIHLSFCHDRVQSRKEPECLIGDILDLAEHIPKLRHRVRGALNGNVYSPAADADSCRRHDDNTRTQHLSESEPLNTGQVPRQTKLSIDIICSLP